MSVPASTAVQTQERLPVALVKKVSRKNLPVVELRIDRYYQRDPKPPLVADIVAHFNEEAFGALLVGRRQNGAMYIVDGQQRFLAIKEMDWTEVPCEVFASNGPMHEAEVYTLVNLKRRKLSSLDEFKALLAKQDVIAKSVKRIVEAEKWSLSVKTREKHSSKDVKAVNTLMKILKQRGDDNLKLTLRTIAKAWPGDPQMGFSTLLDGMSIYLKRIEGTKVDLDRVLVQFQRVTVREVLYSSRLVIPAKSGESTRSAAVADVLEKFARRTGRKAKT